jgi:hypothetical protein
MAVMRMRYATYLDWNERLIKYTGRQNTEEIEIVIKGNTKHITTDMPI